MAATAHRRDARTRSRAGSPRWDDRAPIVVLALVLAATAAVKAQQFGDWGPAVNAGPQLNSPLTDGCPIEAPDGHQLFMASNREGSAGLDIWVSTRSSESHPWEAPARLPAPVNSAANDFCPTPLPGNRLLFVSTRSNTCGGGNNADIYYAQLHPSRGWLPPQHLGCAINSPFEEFSPSLVEAEGTSMLFFSSNRLTGVAGQHDLYVSVLLPDGTFGPAQYVAELNSGADDARPNVRKDGLEIVFDSTRNGGASEIFTSTRASVFAPWAPPSPLGAHVNDAIWSETRASLSRDGTRLTFGSNRPGGLGGSDVYVSTRSGPGRGHERRR